MLKAIETIYNDFRFRSRIEARWGKFFDALGIKYDYEPEGFDLGNGIWYLPDFWLPQQECWIEIKGAIPLPEEKEKASDLAIQSGKMVFILWGGIPRVTSYAVEPEESGYAYFPCGSGDSQYWWCECPDCGAVGLEYNGRSDRLPCKESYFIALKREDSSSWRAIMNRPLDDTDFRTGCPRHSGNLDKGYTYNSPRILAAYTAARQARFEHGQIGAPSEWKTTQ